MFYLGLAWLCTGLGSLGIFLPLLPTTPFILVAAWAASRGSPRFHRWLHRHPRFGPLLRAWYRERALSLRVKCSATGLLLLSWLTLVLFGMPVTGLLVAALFFSVIATFLWTRKTASPESGCNDPGW